MQHVGETGNNIMFRFYQHKYNISNREHRFQSFSTSLHMDIDSLHTNIDIGEGLQAIQESLTQNPDPTKPDTELLQRLYISLTKNDFEFNNTFYLQVKGTAMGKKFALAYDNIFMVASEKQVLQSAKYKPKYYYRFLDDILGVWTYSLQDFQEFVQSIYQIKPSITVKATIHSKRVTLTS